MMSNERLRDRSALEQDVSASPPREMTVLYMAREGEDTNAESKSVPTVLEDAHGMDVHVVHSTHAAIDALNAEDWSFECVVTEYTERSTAERVILDYVQNAERSLPVIVYSDARSDPNALQATLQAGADDYVSKATDTDRCTLLANRIEHCVRLQREYAITHQIGAAVEETGQGVLITNPDGRIHYVNQLFESVFDYDRTDLLDQPLTVLQADDANDADYQECLETVMDGDTWRGELTMSDESGTTVPFDVTVTPIQDGGGTIKRIVAVGTDISERKAYERQLADAWQKYRGVIDAAPDAVFVADADTGEIVETNEAGSDLLGRSKDEIIGMHQSDLHPGDDREWYQEQFDRHFEADEAIFSRLPNGDPITVVTASGERVPVEINTKVIELNEQTLIQGHFRDVSNRREYEDKLKAILDSIPDLAIVYDRDGKYKTVLSGREDVLVDSADALTDKTVHEALPTETADQILDTIRETIDDNKMQAIEYQLTIDGETKWFEARTAPLWTEAYDPECAVLLAREITERKRTQREREVLWQAIDKAHTSLILTDPTQDDNPIVYANRAFEQLTGYSSQEVIGKNCRFLQGNETNPEQSETLRDAYDNEERVTVELRNYRKDGTPFWNQVTVSPVYDTDGTLIRFLGSQQDITERKKRERELKRYETFLDHSRDRLTVLDAEGRIQYESPAVEEILGYEPDERVGERTFGYVHPEDRARTREFFEQYLTGSSPTETIEYRYQRKDGTWTWLESSGRLMVDESGIERVVITSREITERKEREQKLRSFQNAVEHAGHAVMITDTDGVIKYVNPAFEEVTGYTEAEARGRRPSILKSGEHDGRFYQKMWETILGGDVWEGELINERKNGEQYHIEQTIAPIMDETGEIEGFVAINTDTTERKEYEQQLKRERNRLDEFASTVAHDLRNPLSIALGNVELAQQTSGDSLPTLERAVTALERMDILIGEVLTLSKQGQTVQETESVRFTSLLDETWRHVETPIATLTVEPSLRGWFVDSDRTRLCELLENLFRNAVEHAGSDVELRVGRLPDGDGFFVEDDGPGIPPDNHSRVFESGYTTTDDGTGFGLSIVKQIVDAHGWEITVTEADTGGARFEIITATSSS